MKDRRDAILDVAVSLAEEGGFDNVRQREVAAQAGVALGTLYKRFRSKEEILCAALEREAQVLERRMESRPSRGHTPRERIGAFFEAVTRGLCKKPHFARAVLRAMASGVPEIASNVASYQGRMNKLIVAAARGQGTLHDDDPPANETEASLAFLLQQMWFAALVGWSAGLFSQTDAVEHVKKAAALMMPALNMHE
jgi:AcrR family transcriptional regulator